MLLSKENSALLVVDVQTALVPYVMNSERFIERCHWIMRLAAALEVPTFLSEQYPKGLGPTVAPLNDPNLYQDKAEKVHFSCAKDLNLMSQMKAFNKTQWVLIGIETHVCVLQTALDLMSAGYGVYVSVDAVSARHELDHKYGLKRMKHHDVELVTAEMIFFEWVKQAGTAEFKALSQTFMKGA